MAAASSRNPQADGALAMGRRFADRSLDPVAAAEAAFTAVEAAGDGAIFTRLTRERALREAEASRGRLGAGLPAGALDGVPVAWKDLFDLEGMATTAGSRILADAPAATKDAPVVARLREAGMVAVGRTNMTEFAFSGLGLNPHYGTPRNPHGTGPARIPGGSSSGSAVAVARSIVPVAIGSDTSGSVRIPAAFNGIVGYKASGGRYPMDGVYPLSPSLDTLGVFSHDVEDAIAVDAVLRGGAPARRSAAPLAGRRLIVPENVMFDDADRAVVDRFEDALGRLAALGIAVEHRRIPAFDAIRELFARTGALVTAEAYAHLRDKVDGPRAGEIDRRVVERARTGGSIGTAALAELLDARRRLVAEGADLLGRDAFAAFPSVAIVAPELAPLEADDKLFFATNALVLRNTMLASFLDWCGVSIPSGTDEGGLPTGFLISGPPGSDDVLLGFAAACEASVRPA